MNLIALYCADFNIFYRDIFNVKDCVRGYLENGEKTFDEVMNIVNRDHKKNSWDINRTFNLDEVTSLVLSENIVFQPGQLAVLINALRLKKMVNLQSFAMRQPTGEGWEFNLTDICVFGQFIQNSSTNSSVETLSLNMKLNNEWVISIANALPKTKIRSFSLAGLDTSNLSSITALAEGLKNSKVIDLTLAFDINMIKAIAAILPDSNITWLRIEGGNITSAVCQAIAKQLSKSRIERLSFFFGNVEADPFCVNALIEGIINRTQDFHLRMHTKLTSNAIELFAKALPEMKHLKTLEFYNEIIAQSTIFALFQALPQSQLTEFRMTFPSGLNYSTVIPQVADAINQSMITNFIFYTPDLSSSEIGLLISFLPNKLRKITGLSLSALDKGIETEQVTAFFEILPNTSIKYLYLTNISVKNTLTVLAKVLPRTMIKTLGLFASSITENDISHLAKVLNESKIEDLQLSDNNIGDKSVGVLFEGLQNSSVKLLYLDKNNISDIGAKEMTRALTADKKKHGLWIENLNTTKQISLVRALASYNPKTSLTLLDVRDNHIGNESATTICNVLPQTEIVPTNLNLSGMCINQSIIDNCGIISNSNSLRPMSPYILLYHLYQATHQSFYTLLYNRYRIFITRILFKP